LTAKIIRTLGPYSLIEILGRGTMGVVYKAYDPACDSYVAIKTLAAEFVDDSKLRESFYREARLAAKLNHSNIIQILNLGEQEREIYLVMELLEGKDLKQMLKERTQATLEQKTQWMIQLCEALAHAHKEGIIHCDIKPGNLYICKNGRLVVMDFGIARAGALFTGTGSVVGTPDYIAPEQIMALRTDHRADIFSMGIVFYELLTAIHPFRSRSLPSTIHRILNENPPSPHDLAPVIPPYLSKLVLKALEKDVNLRFQSCEDVLLGLRSAESKSSRI
jgi:serine/threonine protein kinase